MEKWMCQSKEKLELNSAVLKEVYQQVDKLANSKYKTAIHTLQTRHKGYESEDFVQEAVEKVVKAFSTKNFATLSKLKGFINFVMEFHYLKEKRKFFYTHRGLATVVSFDDPIIEDLTIGDTIEAPSTVQLNELDKHSLFNKNLFLINTNNYYSICTLEELRKYKSGIAISINYFIEIQRDLGLQELCRYYKNNGFYMTKPIFEEISQVIIDYIQLNQLVII